MHARCWHVRECRTRRHVDTDTSDSDDSSTTSGLLIHLTANDSFICSKDRKSSLFGIRRAFLNGVKNEGTSPMRGSPKLASGISVPATLRATPGKDTHMKKLLVLLAICLSVSVPSFGAEHLVTHSAKVAGKDTYKVTKYSVKEAGKFLKFMF
jgi:hypothetical protein